MTETELVAAQEARDMQLLLAGFIAGDLANDGKQCMRIVKVIPTMSPPGVEVTFASGLRLAVKVEIVDQP